MIQLTRINHVGLVLNSDLIEHIEATPDTVISLTTGQKFMVRETPDEVIARVIGFRRSICEPYAMVSGSLARPGAVTDDDSEDSQ